MNHQVEIAKTITEQIRATDHSALAAWGAKNFVALQEGEVATVPGHRFGYVLGGLQFSIRTPKIQRGGKVLVYLTPNDTYTVRAGRTVKYEWKDIEIAKDVYCDNLVAVIDSIIEDK